jgi:hypothetical protein
MSYKEQYETQRIRAMKCAEVIQEMKEKLDDTVEALQHTADKYFEQKLLEPMCETYYRLEALQGFQKQFEEILNAHGVKIVSVPDPV